MKILKAKVKDFKEIAKIYKDGFNEEPYNEGWTLTEALKKIKIFKKYCDIWVSKEDKEVVGFLIINPSHWRIGEIAFGEEIGVKKEFRKNNVATLMLEYIFNHYKKKGYKKFMGVIDKDAKSFGLIKKLNLKIVKNNLLIEKEIK